jgi:hypothetical protein
MEKRTAKRKSYIIVFFNAMDGQRICRQYGLPGPTIECLSILGSNKYLVKANGIEVTATINENMEIY